MKKKLKYFGISLIVLVLLFIIYFFTIRQLDRKILESIDVQENVIHSGALHSLLNTHFIDGERFYFKIPISIKDTIMAFGDTGGGISFLMPTTKNKGNLDSKLKYGILKGMLPVQYILFEDLVNDLNIPRLTPINSSPFILRNPFKRVREPILVMPPMEDELKLMMDVQPEVDVFFGQDFFMNSSWKIDYPERKIWVNTPLHDSLLHQQSLQKLGFRKNSKGQKLNGHPSMTIEVDCEKIDVLFDTGATIILSKEGKRQLKTDKKTLGGSFIAASIFEQWRKKHPDWVYYPKADLVGDIIEVPIVKIGEYEVGPVLFAVRRDEVWSDGMVSSMDKVVKGAIGGSALKYLKVTIDYNSEFIRFEH